MTASLFNEAITSLNPANYYLAKNNKFCNARAEYVEGWKTHEYQSNYFDKFVRVSNNNKSRDGFAADQVYLLDCVREERIFRECNHCGPEIQRRKSELPHFTFARV